MTKVIMLIRVTVTYGTMTSQMESVIRLFTGILHLPNIVFILNPVLTIGDVGYYSVKNCRFPNKPGMTRRCGLRHDVM